jgi:hypothetical protein
MGPLLRPTRPTTNPDEDAKVIEDALMKIKDSFDDTV